MVRAMQALPREREVGGVPHAAQKSRAASEELRKVAGVPRVQAKSASCTGASGANGPPTAFWHIRQWQMCVPCGAA